MSTALRSRNALARAVLSLCVAVSCLLALGTRAHADDPAPRAVPAARGYERAFSSYDALVAYATTVAKTQSALDARLAEARTSFERLVAAVDAIAAARGRGAHLDPESAAAWRRMRSEETVLSARAATVQGAQQQLVAAGALTGAVTPWRMPTEGEITQEFGPTDLWVEPAREYGGVAYAHFHEGVDIAGAWAAPVVAPARGRVVFVGAMSDGAEVVVLAHDGGIVTMYVHLDGYASPPPVKAGDEVAAGQRIGTVGLTGITTGEHLHWAAWRSGSLIDPLSLIGK